MDRLPEGADGEEAKRRALALLALKRQSRSYPGFYNVGDFAGGAYDCLHVSPYTRGADNNRSPIMIVLQDWCSEEWLSRRGLDPDLITLGRDPDLPTNRNLEFLLSAAFGLQLRQVYATNLFPFVKPRSMSAALPPAVFERAAADFTIPEIEIVRPRLVIALGLPVYRTLQKELTGKRFRGTIAVAIDNPVDVEVASIPVRLWGQAHPGALGMANRGRVQAVMDWRTMGEWLSHLAIDQSERRPTV